MIKKETSNKIDTANSERSLHTVIEGAEVFPITITDNAEYPHKKWLQLLAAQIVWKVTGINEIEVTPDGLTALFTGNEQHFEEVIELYNKHSFIFIRCVAALVLQLESAKSQPIIDMTDKKINDLLIVYVKKHDLFYKQ